MGDVDCGTPGCYRDATHKIVVRKEGDDGLERVQRPACVPCHRAFESGATVSATSRGFDVQWRERPHSGEEAKEDA